MNQPAGATTIPAGLSVGAASGGTSPYGFAEGTPDVAWLDVVADGTIALTTGMSVPPEIRTYTLNVVVTDGASGTVNGSTTIAVEQIEILDVVPKTVVQADLDAGWGVAVTLALSAHGSNVSYVTFRNGGHAPSLLPGTVTENSAQVALNPADIILAGTSAPVYGRYAVSVLTAAWEIGSTQYVNIIDTVRDGWQAALELTGDPTGVKRVEFGSALNGLDASDATEDILAPPPPPSTVASIGLDRDGQKLTRDIIGVNDIDDVLTWQVKIVIPDGVTGTLSWPGLGPVFAHYTHAALDFAGQRVDLTSQPYQALTLPGTYEGTLRLSTAAIGPPPPPPREAMPMHLPGEWSLVSLPGPADEGSVDQLLAWNVDTVYRWNAVAQMYDLVSGTAGLTPIVDGYFLHRDPALGGTTETFHVDMTAPSAQAANIVLESGWTCIGVIDGGLTATTLAAPHNTIFRWNAASSYYEPVSGLMYPLHGYWVYNDGPQRSVPVTRPITPPPAPAPIVQAELPRADWALPFTLDVAGGHARTLELGASGLAKVGYDAMDIPQPPLPSVEGAVELYAHVDGRARRSDTEHRAGRSRRRGVGRYGEPSRLVHDAVGRA
jgi:hypothetical protein